MKKMNAKLVYSILFFFGVYFCYLVFAKYVIGNPLKFSEKVLQVIKTIHPLLSTRQDLTEIYKQWAVLNFVLASIAYYKRTQLEYVLGKYKKAIECDDSGIPKVLLLIYPFILATSFLGYIHYGFFSPGIGSWTYPDGMTLRTSSVPNSPLPSAKILKVATDSLYKDSIGYLHNGIYKGLVQIAEDTHGNYAVYNENLYGLVFPNYVIEKSEETNLKIWKFGANNCLSNTCGILPCSVAYPPHSYAMPLACPSLDINQVSKLTYWSAFVEVKNRAAKILNMTLEKTVSLNAK